MRRRIATFAQVVVLVAIAAAQAVHGASPAVTAPQVESPKRILFVGNSYFYYNGSLHFHARRIAMDADAANASAYEYKSATIAAAPLAHHNIEHLVTPGKLDVKEAFDLVVLQTNSTDAMSERDRARFRASAIEFSAAIAKRGGKTALYMTPAHVKPSKWAGSDLMARTAEMHIAVGNEIGALVIPVGLAFEEAYRRRPQIKLHTELDGSHPTLLGTYLAACTVYASLYARRCEGNRYDYQGTIDRDDAAFLQKVADDTVQKFFDRPPAK